MEVCLPVGFRSGSECALHPHRVKWVSRLNVALQISSESNAVSYMVSEPKNEKNIYWMHFTFIKNIYQKEIVIHNISKQVTSLLIVCQLQIFLII